MTILALYIVATPIGHPLDISERAKQILSQVDIIAAEDTRRTKQLLKHLNIKYKKIISYYDYNEQKKTKLILDYQNYSNVALVSDSGTPLISDPGYHLVSQARQKNIPVIPIPGPCALIAALSVSGLAINKFVFEGFIPRKEQEKYQYFKNLANETRTMVFYESTKRLLATLSIMIEQWGKNRRGFIAREISKTFETYMNGQLEELANKIRADQEQQRGEIVLIVKGASKKSNDILSEEEKKWIHHLQKKFSVKNITTIMQDMYGGRKKTYYKYTKDLE